MTRRIDQFFTSLADGDAISTQMLNLQQLLRRQGYRSELFCEQLPIHFSGQTAHFSTYAEQASPDDILLLHFSLNYSAAVMAWLQEIPARKVLVYHNITPATYFAGTNPVSAESARLGRRQLAQLAELTEAGWGDSTYNVAELSAVGWSQVGVLPIIFNPERLTVRPDPKILKSWQTGVNLLFVGRIAPNKCFEDLILTFHYLKQTRCPNARLFLVGSSRGMEPYLAFLEALINRLALTDVFFAGHASAAQWAAYYQVASLYLSLSEHEGFGVPLLESMYFGVPIVAYKATAVPETLGGSGVLVKTKDHAAIAELIAEILGDESLRNQLIAGQKARLQAFLPEVVGQQLQALLGQLSIGSS